MSWRRVKSESDSESDKALRAECSDEAHEQATRLESRRVRRVEREKDAVDASVTRLSLDASRLGIE